jgi:hypothetical protein
MQSKVTNIEQKIAEEFELDLLAFILAEESVDTGVMLHRLTKDDARPAHEWAPSKRRTKRGKGLASLIRA